MQIAVEINRSGIALQAARSDIVKINCRGRDSDIIGFGDRSYRPTKRD